MHEYNVREPVRRTSEVKVGHPIQPHLLHVDDASSVLRDVVQRELQLLLAVASKRPQDLGCEALVVHSDRHAFQIRQVFLETEERGYKRISREEHRGKDSK